MLVCINDNEELVKLMLKDENNKNKILNQKEEWNGNTALHYACKKGNIGIAEILLNEGANYNVENNSKKKPEDLLQKSSTKTMFKKKIQEIENKNSNTSSHVVPISASPISKSVEAPTRELK